MIHDKEIHGDIVEDVQFLWDECSLHDHPLRNIVVPTRSVWYVILFRERGVVHRITYNFNYFFFTCCFIYSIYSRYKITERYIQ